MNREKFLEKWGAEYDVVNSEKSFKLVKKEDGKAVIWVTSGSHGVGITPKLPNIELVSDFIDLCKEAINPW
ncbi:hypothetical protein [Spiroplasma endosymbiont of Crioceris asparagi]|uniref:hypothetical protein n=1 Tax=Spiroplasma endosymbiont of Crioceris asparagi TaxID=3066286 RepID=UPI0030CF0CE5